MTGKTETEKRMDVNQFIEYLKRERKSSDNTCDAYRRDVQDFQRFMESRGTEDLTGASNADVAAYLLEPKNRGK